MTGHDEQLDSPTAAPETALPAHDSIGGLLRSQRLALGRDVAFVAEHLRIRGAYIRAIEEGRYMDLPGSTYAIGFVRSYAEFLGLDPGETVRRFKEETAGGLHNKPELLFPSPVSEGRIPGGAILFLGLVLAATSYGSWYYMSSREVSIAELVPALPNRLQALIGDGQAETATATATPPGEPESKPQPAKIEMPPAAPAAKTETAPAAPAASAPAPATAAVTPAPPAVTAAPAPTPAPPPAPAPEVAAAPPAPAQPAAAPAKPKVDEQAVPPDEEEEAPKPVNTAAAPALPTQHPEPLDGGKIYGAYNADSRITLRSRDTAWVEVRDSKDKKIWAQTLRKGDVYRVPNNASYTMLTGSAGALDVYVDGKQAPSLGQMGTVRRGIQLDPEKLLAGQ